MVYVYKYIDKNVSKKPLQNFSLEVSLYSTHGEICHTEIRSVSRKDLELNLLSLFILVSPKPPLNLLY